MLRSETIGHLAEALAAAQGEFDVVKKDETAQAGGKFSYRYADLASVVTMASKILAKHGLAVAQFPEAMESGYEGLTTLVMHSSGEWMSSSMPLLMPERATPQQQGSAITYARRYSYGAVLGIVTDADDDGAKASEGSRSSTPVPTAVVEGPPRVDGDTGEVDEEDIRARNLRLLEEHRGRNVPTQHAQSVAQKLATRTRPSPRRPMP